MSVRRGMHPNVCYCVIVFFVYALLVELNLVDLSFFFLFVISMWWVGNGDVIEILGGWVLIITKTTVQIESWCAPIRRVIMMDMKNCMITPFPWKSIWWTNDFLRLAFFGLKCLGSCLEELWNFFILGEKLGSSFQFVAVWEMFIDSLYTSFGAFGMKEIKEPLWTTNAWRLNSRISLSMLFSYGLHL